MIKVFLTEDEYAIRERIKKSIKWEQHGFELVGEAGDGETALPEILKTKPDILLTDISMPFMDGLKLSELVKKQLPDIRIIVISGYDDFNYAKQAISIGVQEYLLKPITSGNLIDVLKKTSDEIIRQRQEELDISRVDINTISQETILKFLSSGSAADTEKVVDEYFNSMGPGMLESMMLRQYVLVKAVFAVAAFFERLGLDKEGVSETLGDLANPAPYADSSERAHQYMIELLNTAMEQRGLVSDKGHTEVIEEAKRYIRENYQNEDMSLNSVAAHVNISSNHFSAIFKKETGETFIDYLTAVRIEKAKELLTCTNMKTSDVGFEVGYRDPHYFSSIFKKTVGQPPKEYRRARQDEQGQA